MFSTCDLKTALVDYQVTVQDAVKKVLTVLEVSVRTSLASNPHLITSTSRESRNSTPIVVISNNFVSVRVVLVSNLQITSGSNQTSLGVVTITGHTTNLTFNIGLLNVGGSVLNLDNTYSGIVISVGLTGHFIALGITSHDGITLLEGSCEWCSKGDLSIRLGVTTLLVDTLGIFEGLGCFESELGLDGLLIEIDGTVIGDL